MDVAVASALIVDTSGANPSGPWGAVDVRVDGVEAGGGRDEEAVSLGPAEADVRDHLGHEDLPQQVARRGQAVHAVVRAGPDAAGGVDPEPVEPAGVAPGQDLP